MITQIAIVKNTFLLFGLDFGYSKSVKAMVLFKLGSPDGCSIFLHFAITDGYDVQAFKLGYQGSR